MNLRRRSEKLFCKPNQIVHFCIEFFIQGEFVVMPNHIHGIIIIGENQYNSDDLVRALGIDEDTNARRDVMHHVSTNNPNRVSTNNPNRVSTNNPNHVSTNTPNRVSTNTPNHVVSTNNSGGLVRALGRDVIHHVSTNPIWYVRSLSK